MKKITLLLLFVISLTHLATAQSALPEFAPHGATWTYEYIDFSSNPSGDHYLDIFTVADHDTVVAGKTCRIILADTTQFMYVYRDSLKLYVYRVGSSTNWSLAYDFGANVGDTLRMHDLAYFNNTYPYIVTAKRDTVLNGDTLPMLILGRQAVIPTIVAVMNIGALNTSFLPDILQSMIPEFGGITVRCYSDTVLGSVKAPGVVNCDTNFHVSVPVVTASNDILFYPNPATNEVHLTNPQLLSAIEILSVDGRTMKRVTAPENDVQLNVPGGIYAVILHLKNGSTITKRLTIQQ